MPTNRMICPVCGATMNFHAEKIDRSAEFERQGDADPHFGGVLIEIHSCPACGAMASRPAPDKEES